MKILYVVGKTSSFLFSGAIQIIWVKIRIINSIFKIDLKQEFKSLKALN